jgi:hypothetical protein
MDQIQPATAHPADLKSGRTSAPRLPETSQTKRGSTSEKPNVVRPPVSHEGDRMAQVIAGAIDPHPAHARLAHVAKGDLLGHRESTSPNGLPILEFSQTYRYFSQLQVSIVYLGDYRSRAQYTPRHLAPDTDLSKRANAQWLAQYDAAVIEQQINAADPVLGCSDFIAAGVGGAFAAHETDGFTTCVGVSG